MDTNKIRDMYQIGSRIMVQTTGAQVITGELIRISGVMKATYAETIMYVVDETSKRTKPIPVSRIASICAL